MTPTHTLMLTVCSQKCIIISSSFQMLLFSVFSDTAVLVKASLRFWNIKSLSEEEVSWITWYIFVYRSTHSILCLKTAVNGVRFMQPVQDARAAKSLRNCLTEAWLCWCKSFLLDHTEVFISHSIQFFFVTFAMRW